MSRQAVLDLRTLINEHPEIQRVAMPHMAPLLDRHFMIELGKAHGLLFTDDDIRQEFDQVMASPDRELSDFELELVAGGGGGSATGPLVDNGK